jgi:FAD/FMN-containing dehydrogenase
MTEARDSHESKKQALLAQFQAMQGTTVQLRKETSNLFRDRQSGQRKRLDVRALNEVLEIDTQAGWVDGEGMIPYEALVEATLDHGVMPAVVPELKSITLGGAAAGVGIEASSFRYGLAHETLLEVEILVGDGRVLVVPVKPYVCVNRVHHTDAVAFFQDLHQWTKSDVDFIDGVVFSPHKMYINLGRFVDEAPYTSDYSYKEIYYRSIPEKPTDYLTTRDFIWRWDTDWFWCSKNLYAQNPLVRRLLGPARLNSLFYTRAMRWNSRWGLTRRLDRLARLHRESVIQDVDIPIGKAPEFLEFFHRAIGILPVWICPTHPFDASARFDLFPMEPDVTYVNFGFWDVVRTREPHPGGYHNRRLEQKVNALGGIKSLYSDSYFPAEEFWQIYNKPAYDRLKAQYDPHGMFKDLYQKCVSRE